MYKSNFYPEGDDREILHNHFDCPICNIQYAGTSIYKNIGELEDYEKQFSCESCNSTFEFIDSIEGTFYLIKTQH